jgi:hypothetical protein
MAPFLRGPEGDVWEAAPHQPEVMRRGGQDGHEEDVVSVGNRSGVVKRLAHACHSEIKMSPRIHFDRSQHRACCAACTLGDALLEFARGRDRLYAPNSHLPEPSLAEPALSGRAFMVYQDGGMVIAVVDQRDLEEVAEGGNFISILSEVRSCAHGSSAVANVVTSQDERGINGLRSVRVALARTHTVDDSA